MGNVSIMDWAGEELRELILVRSGGVCECCGISRRHSLHHRTPRGMGGSTDQALVSPANIVALCGHGTVGCHGGIESSRALATAYGWLVPRGGDLESVPILYRGHWALLDKEGFVDYIPSAETLRLPRPRDWPMRQKVKPPFLMRRR